MRSVLKDRLENPATPFEDFEMYVLSDFDAQMKSQNEMYQRSYWPKSRLPLWGTCGIGDPAQGESAG